MVSVEDLTGGNLTVNVEGVTGIIVAGAGRKGVALAVPSGSTGNITVTLTPVSSAVSYKRVQIEQGSAATAFEWRFAGLELSLCQRYFQKLSTTSGTAFVMATAYTATNALGFLYLPVSMRAAPTIAVTGTIGMTPGTGSGTAGITVVSNQIMAIIVSQTSVTVGNSGYFSATAGGQSISLSSEL
jgi:hypothetical protein